MVDVVFLVSTVLFFLAGAAYVRRLPESLQMSRL
jgi:hypothetical protein